MNTLQIKELKFGNPVGIERATNIIRKGLDNEFVWITRPYHLAQVFYRNTEKGAFYYPESYIGKKDGKFRHQRVTPDNDFPGQIFFVVGEEKVKDDFSAFDVGIIFSVNLELIDSAKLEEYLFTEELIIDVKKHLKSNSYTNDFSYEIKSVYRDLRSVYKEFTLDKIEQYNRAPLQVFRFNLQIIIETNNC